MGTRNIYKNFVIASILILVFSFFTGYYLCFRIIGQKEKTKLEIITDIMENEWYYGLDEDDISEILEKKQILGMLDLEKDPYTKYLESLGTLADSFTGIGIGVTYYGKYLIVNEVSSEAALDDGIKIGDILVEINEQSLANKTIKELGKMISNLTDVKLKVIRENQEIIINTKVTKYSPITVFTKEYENVSYVKISEFNLDTATSLKEYLDNLSSNCTNLIIDLRDNPGGYITAVQQVVDLFLPSEKVVLSTEDKNGNTTIIKTTDNGMFLFDKILILINKNSASGAEAMAAAMNYHLNDIVTLYGEKTFGKGSAQKTHYFQDGTYFHYTYALWNTPEGTTINKTGVQPEIINENKGISSAEVYDECLELYDQGKEVLGIQEFLYILGYYTGSRHGFFDEYLSNAIKKFQADIPENEGVLVTGIIDDNTLRYISKLIYQDSITFKETELNNVLRSMLP